jgi:hypothetical protein
MNTILCDFCRVSAKKIGVFLRNQCYDQIFEKLHSSSYVEQKTPNFFREKILIYSDLESWLSVEASNKWRFKRPRSRS